MTACERGTVVTVYLADAVVAAISYVHTAHAVGADTPVGIYLRCRGGAAIAGIARCAGTGHRGDNARCVHLAHTVIAVVANVDVAQRVSSYTPWLIDRRCGRSHAVSDI